MSSLLASGKHLYSTKYKSLDLPEVLTAVCFCNRLMVESIARSRIPESALSVYGVDKSTWASCPLWFWTGTRGAGDACSWACKLKPHIWQKSASAAEELCCQQVMTRVSTTEFFVENSRWYSKLASPLCPPSVDWGSQAISSFSIACCLINDKGYDIGLSCGLSVTSAHFTQLDSLE